MASGSEGTAVDSVTSDLQNLSTDNPLFEESSNSPTPAEAVKNRTGKAEPADASWASLSPRMFHRILLSLSWQDVRVARMVCRQWRKRHGSAVAGLTPTVLQATAVGELFPSLRVLDLSRATQQPETDLKQQLVELSVTTANQLNSLKMPEGAQMDDLMLAVIGSFGGLSALSLEGTRCTTDSGSLAALSPLQHLQALDLSRAMGLTDAGIESLATLSGITQLNLSGCFEVTGSGLALLGGITALTNLNLNGCPNVDDTVLSQLTRLTNLYTLDIAYCGQVTDKGIAAIAGSPPSDRLFAAGDTLAGVGAVFGEFGNALGNAVGRSHHTHHHALSSLTTLNLSGCPEITDMGLSSLKNLTQLWSLDLLGCWMVTGAGLPSLTTLTQLQTLSIEVKEGLDDKSLSALACLTTLRHLRMERCKFCVTDQGIERLEQLPALQKMELAYCSGLSDVFVATIGHMSSLTTLNLLKSDGVTQAGLAALTALSRLKHLDLTGCNDVSDIVFLCLSRLTCLESLILANCGSWSEQGIVSLTGLENLRLLDLGYLNTPLSDVSLSGLTSGLSGLTYLDLSGAGNVTDTGFESLANCQHLLRLELEGCTGFGAFGMAAVSRLPHLTSLNLQECQRVEADALEMLTSLYGLRELNLLDCPGGSPEVVDKLIACLPFLSSLTAA